MNYLFADLRLALHLALRARFLPTTVWLSLALAVAVLMAAQFSGRQPATVALDVGLSVIRLALPLLIVLLAQELLTREFDRRYFLTSLAYPRPRAQFLMGRFAAIYLLALVLLAVLGAILAALVALVGQGYEQATPVALDGPYLLTLLFLAVDLLVLTALATLLAITAVTPSFVLIGTFGFMLVARAYAGIIALLQEQGGLVGDAELYQGSLSLLGYLLPNLGALDIRMVSLYSSMQFLPADWPASIGAAVAYSLLLLSVSVWVLRRKRLS